MKQNKDQGLHLPVVAGAPAGDDALLKSVGDEAIGMISSTFHSNDVDTPSSKKLIDRMVREYTRLTQYDLQKVVSTFDTERNGERDSRPSPHGT